MENQSSCSPDLSCGDQARFANGRAAAAFRNSRPAGPCGRAVNGTARYTGNSPSAGVRQSVRAVNSRTSCGSCPEDLPDPDQRYGGFPGVFPADYPVGMSYTPPQIWGEPYDPSRALARGTLFPVLDKPFLGRRPAK